MQIDTVHGLKTEIYSILNEGIALPLNNRLERVNLHEKYDYPILCLQKNQIVVQTQSYDV